MAASGGSRTRRAATVCMLTIALACIAAPTAAATRRTERTPAEPRMLPATVEAALARNGVPREALVAWVQEVE